ncbi:uncharacterized protein TNCV_1908161 [Trichonephila clavipes]|nr:uncharacterized protein TNCV_1908161 [Trichonephila clavipes]
MLFAFTVAGFQEAQRLTDTNYLPFVKSNLGDPKPDFAGEAHMFSVTPLLHNVTETVKAAVAQWFKVWDHGRHVMRSSPVPLKTRPVGQRCTLNLSRAETSSRWCGVVVRRGGASSGVIHVT